MKLILNKRRTIALTLAITTMALTAACGGDSSDTPVASAPATPPAPAACPAQLSVGYQVTSIGGVKAAIWYPTTEAEKAFQYSPDVASSLASNAAPTTCARFPLVVFSHGLFGCGTQSLFVTETLARRGYVVVAPDHPDALCSVDGAPPSGTTVNEPSVADPASWTDSTYAERFQQVRSIVDTLLAGSAWTRAKSMQHEWVSPATRSALHRLWNTRGLGRWKTIASKRRCCYRLTCDLISCKIASLLCKARDVSGCAIRSWHYTHPARSKCVYAASSPPKYLTVLAGGSHFEWTNLACLSTATITNCLQIKPNAKLIADYSIDFFERYLKGAVASLLDGNGAGLLLYQKQLE